MLQLQPLFEKNIGSAYERSLILIIITRSEIWEVSQWVFSSARSRYTRPRTNLWREQDVYLWIIIYTFCYMTSFCCCKLHKNLLFWQTLKYFNDCRTKEIMKHTDTSPYHFLSISVDPKYCLLNIDVAYFVHLYFASYCIIFLQLLLTIIAILHFKK